jgi:hypothetical protein
VSSFQQIFSYARTTEELDEHRPPEWLAPPDQELGEPVPLSIVVGRSERAVVALREAVAYSTGTHLEFLAFARGLPRRQANELFHLQHPMPDEDPPPELLRIGVELADGARISNLGNPHHRNWNERPGGPVLVPHGGGGGSGVVGQVELRPAYWLWPLPPPGQLRVFVEWPALAVELTSVEIGAAPIIEAASRSQRLWPE